MAEFRILKQVLADLEDRLKNDLVNLSTDNNSITWRKHVTGDDVSEGQSSIPDLSRFSEMTVWINSSAGINRSDKILYMKVRDLDSASSLTIEVRLKWIDQFRPSVRFFYRLLHRIKRARLNKSCAEFDKKLASVNSDRIDKILLGDGSCRKEKKRNWKLWKNF